MYSRTVFDRPWRRDPILVVWAAIVAWLGWVALNNHTTWSGTMEGTRVRAFLTEFSTGVMTSFLLLALLPACLRWLWRHGWPHRRQRAPVVPPAYFWRPGSGGQPGQPWSGGHPQWPATVTTAAGFDAGGAEAEPGCGPGRCPRWTCCQNRDEERRSAGLRAPRDPDPLDAGRWIRAVSTQRLLRPADVDAGPGSTPEASPGAAPPPPGPASATDGRPQPVVDLPRGAADLDEPDLRIPAPHIDLGAGPRVWPPAPGMQLPPVDVSLPPGRFGFGRAQEHDPDGPRDPEADERGRR
jgi:hypothetical protein